MTWPPKTTSDKANLTNSAEKGDYQMHTRSDSNSSLKVPLSRRSTRRRRNSSIAKDFGQMSVEWEGLTATVDTTTKTERWR